MASASRQKPAATGPTSASRTIHGPAASTRLARISAGKARRGGDWCISICNPYISARRSMRKAANALPVRPDQARRHRRAQPHPDGAADPRPRDPRACPDRADADYYAQRAGAGLIITEATGISRQGLGWPYAPGLWTEEQVEAWKPVTEAVHEAGGRIFAQLWHMGRVVHPSFLGGGTPVSSSATTAPYKAHTYDGRQPYAEARALELDEIPRLLDDYARRRRATRSRPGSTASRSTPRTAI